jgi:hypothetical protein
LISGVITGVTAGAIGFIGAEFPADEEAAGLRFAALFFAGFFLAALRAGFFFAAFFEDFFFEDFFFDAFFFATRFLEDFFEDFFFAVFFFAAGFFFAAFFFAAMVKLLSMLDRLSSRGAVSGFTPHQASVIHMNEIGDRILFARSLNKLVSRVTIWYDSP